MPHRIRGMVLPEAQRRTLDELTGELDLRVGDTRSRQSAYWTMLTLSAIIASAGILAESTATVIGAMIIAPLSTPIMAGALAIAKRERNGALIYVAGGIALVVGVGVLFSGTLPRSYDLLGNDQIAGRTSPGLLDMIAALATGLAGAVALARRDVAAVLPGVAIAISLVPPLAVIGVCLGEGDLELAFGAALLFASNVLALVLAGTLVFTMLGYASENVARQGGSQRRTYTILGALLGLVAVPLLANTVVTYALTVYETRAKQIAEEWVEDTPGAVVTDVQLHGTSVAIHVQAPDDLPPGEDLLEDLDGEIPPVIGIILRTTQGEQTELRPPGGG